MKFITLSIPLILLTGCFNWDTPKEKSIEKTEQNITSQTTVSPQNSSAKKFKTYTREEILKRRRGNGAICTTAPAIEILKPIPTETETTILEEEITPLKAPPIYPDYCNVYTENDFVSEDVTPIQNNIVEQSELKNYIDSYLEQLQSLNIDGIISMTYPKLFKPINETLFRKYISTIVNSSQITVESFKTKLIYLGDVYPYDGGEFSQIIYQSDITLNFLNPELYKDELSIRVLNNVLAGKYGQENIHIDSSARTINIKKEEKLLAIKEENEEWKFIGDNPSYRRVYPRVLPMGILSQL